MDTFLFILALATLVILAVSGTELILGVRSIPSLHQVSHTLKDRMPHVSVIIPARNEEDKLEEALRSVLAQEYENLQVIAVDDRSTDRTGEILDRLARETGLLEVIHVRELPQGWLGKNHALHAGAQRGRGELFLFTDADVVLHPSAVSKAVAYLQERRLDHLTLAPEICMPGMLLQMFAALFTIFLCLFAKPWKAKDPRSKSYFGVGAFNLVNADVYRAIGTHQAIAMRPDDDLKLGKIIKRHGYKQEVLGGKDLVRVEWYASVRELIQGLMKNMFAGVDYRVSIIVGASLMQFLFYVWPFIALFVTGGSTRFLNLAVVLFLLFLFREATHESDVSPWYGIGFPVATLLFIYVIWRSMVTTLLNRGITWRDTHYPLRDLKANRV